MPPTCRRRRPRTATRTPRPWTRTRTRPAPPPTGTLPVTPRVSCVLYSNVRGRGSVVTQSQTKRHRQRWRRAWREGVWGRGGGTCGPGHSGARHPSCAPTGRGGPHANRPKTNRTRCTRDMCAPRPRQHKAIHRADSTCTLTCSCPPESPSDPALAGAIRASPRPNPRVNSPPDTRRLRCASPARAPCASLQIPPHPPPGRRSQSSPPEPRAARGVVRPARRLGNLEHVQQIGPPPPREASPQVDAPLAPVRRAARVRGGRTVATRRHLEAQPGRNVRRDGRERQDLVDGRDRDAREEPLCASDVASGAALRGAAVGKAAKRVRPTTCVRAGRVHTLAARLVPPLSGGRYVITFASSSSSNWETPCTSSSIT